LTDMWNNSIALQYLCASRHVKAAPTQRHGHYFRNVGTNLQKYTVSKPIIPKLKGQFFAPDRTRIRAVRPLARSFSVFQVYNSSSFHADARVATSGTPGCWRRGRPGDNTTLSCKGWLAVVTVWLFPSNGFPQLRGQTPP
jgi:hypothetical protein